MTTMHEVLNSFERISLEEMKEVSLMDRQESKFLIKKEGLSKLLIYLNEEYLLFSIQNKTILNYNTVYYDTEELEFYSCSNLQSFPFGQFSNSLKRLIVFDCKVNMNQNQQ